MRRRNLYKWGLPVLGLAVALTGQAQAGGTTFDYEGEIRVRNETDKRVFYEDAEAENFTIQRTRLMVTATTEKGAQAVVHLQDSRYWGEEGSRGISDEEGVDIYEAYVHFDCMALPGAKVIAGRQALSYGRERVIGPVGWSNVGRAFDAVRLHVPRDEHWVDVAYAKLSEDVATASDQKVLFLYGHIGLPDQNLAIEPFVVHFEQDPGEYALTSVGDYAKYKSGRFKVQQDFVLQIGSQRVGNDLMDRNAFLIAGEAAIDASPDQDWQYGFIGGYSMYTGNDPDKTDEIGAYDNLFYTGHRFHGDMDLAVSMAGSAGLQDIYGKAWYKLPQGIKAKAAFHLFTTQQDVTVGTAEENALGNEVDVSLWHEAPNGMTMSAGVGFFMPGDLTKAVSGDKTASWGYVQGTLPF
jgi:hypothetical protein